jgi:putative flippase GtrA
MPVPLRYDRPSTLSDLTDPPAPRRRGPKQRAHGAHSVRTSQPPLLHWLVDGHWLGRWRTPLLLKLWRYSAGSVVAFVTSSVTLYVCFSWIGFGAISSSVIAFFAGAVPNWILNRQWAWQKRGRDGMGAETTLYVIVSLVSLVASTAVTKLTAIEAANATHLLKDLLVTASYMFSVVVLTGLKYLAYDRIVFVERRRSSRDQVRSTTEQNLAP